jgi:hypothetical protein
VTMNRLSVTLAAGLSLMWVAPAEEAITGQWMIDPTPLPDQVQLTLHRSNRQFSSHTNSSSFPVNQFKGLGRAQMDSPDGLTVRFELARDAGTLACEGYFKQGHGAGHFTFSQDTTFISDMRALGYSNLSQEQVFSMAVHDVTRKYVRDLRSLGVAGASADDLITMRIHNVTIEYIKELQSMGYAKLQPDQLVTMRIHDATTGFIKQLKALGYDHPSIDQLVTMRIHGVTPAYIQNLHTRGMKSLSIDQLVSLRIHGITD